MAENKTMEPPVVATPPELSKSSKEAQMDTYVVTSTESPSVALSIRIGWLFGILLVGSSIFSIACMGWFAFLWWGTIENATWHSIVINDWAVRAVSFPSSAFRMAIAIQAGACLSMLAAIAIEKSFIPLPSIASISIMRATAPSTTDGILKFIYPLVRAPGSRPLGVLTVVVLAICTILASSVLSFTSTILLSDVTIQPIPSNENKLIVPLDHFWQDVPQGLGYSPGFEQSGFIDRSNTYWKSLNPSVFANFAEASEDPQPVPGLVDTGPTLRAFLPFAKSEDRGRLSHYQGRAVVWDARVVCQEPKFTNLRLVTNGSTILAVTGQVQQSVSADMILEPQPRSIPFFCAVPAIALNVWSRPLICQLPNSDITDSDDSGILPSYGGGLKSQFSLPNRRKRNGGAYLVLNRTILTTQEETVYLQNNPGWVRIQRVPDDLVVALGPNQADGTILGTLCYTPLDVVDRNVTIFRQQPAAEATFNTYQIYNKSDPRYLSNIGRYLYDDVLPKLVPGTPRTTSEERGLFSLEPIDPSWAAAESNALGSDGPWDNADNNVTLPGQLHFLVNQLFLKAGPLSDIDIYGNYTLLPDDYNFRSQEGTFQTESYAVIGRTWQADLYNAVKDHPEGNSALALQALLTVTATTAYYDLLQKLERLELVTIRSFQNVSSPGGPYGTRRGGTYAVQQGGLFATYVHGKVPVGYVIVVVVLAAQLLLVAAVLVFFIRETKFTRIGDPWQALAQIATGDVAGVETAFEVSKQVDSKRDAVEKKLENLGHNEIRVGVQQQRGGSTGLNERERGQV
ncbi:hypothetical protein H072_6612 [Dactylellina haptotyla CBS 200.50]|uniref:Uncharacterized protein n=1 Tax=Dactylellina haptotyla (strain CBS 200.50) TaxID=1284197 RepID=S8BW29_DACHA|nr:hypothetical protein H072_6612 [Dactylellina haptotyla CBS 200.50]